MTGATPLFSSPGPDDQTQAPAEPLVAEVGNTLATREAVQVPATIQSAAVAAAEGAKTAVLARFHMALQQPRDMKEVRKRVLEMCDNPYFAEVALYRKPQGNTTVEGISIRFAEEYVREAGNFHNASTVTWDDDERRTVRVEVTDLERNNTIPADVVVEKYVERFSTDGREVLGSRINKKGKRIYRVRATEDEILLKQNNLVSKAWRSGVERLMDYALKAEAIARIKGATKKAGKAGGKENIDRLVGFFAELGVTQNHLEAYLGHPVAQITPEEYADLRGIGKALEDEETTWEQVVAAAPPPPIARAPKVRSGGYD